MNDHRRIRPLLAGLLAALLLTGCGGASPAQPSPEAAPEETAQTAEPTAAPAEAGEDVVEVSTVDELLAAIAPHTTIVLAGGVYDLTEAANYGKRSRSEYYSWETLLVGDDGSTESELVIRDVEGLTLRGAGMGFAEVRTRPRYANVIRFSGCRELSLSDLTAGHSIEPGACSGGVLYFEDCEGISAERCALYGCGAVALWASNCTGLYADECQLYDCSVSAADLNACRDVLVQNCLVHDNGKNGEYSAFSLFHVYDSEDVTITGCHVRDNEAQSLLASEYSKNVRFVSDTVERNRFFGGVLDNRRYPTLVDGCAFKANTCEGGWYTQGSLPAKTLKGDRLDDAALEAMTLRELTPEDLAESVSDGPGDVPPGGTVRVETVDELLAALGSDRTIRLAEGEYDLSTASDYGSGGGACYAWEESYDGPELVIFNVTGLTIEAEGSDPAATVIRATPRYANVLRFVDCDSLELKGFTAGHTTEPGSCSGGVVYLEDCREVSLDACRLYGCGVLGIQAMRCTGFRVRDCEIYECSYGAVEMDECDGIAFSGCDIHDVPSPALTFWGCGDRTWNDGPIVFPACDVDKNGALVDARS